MRIFVEFDARSRYLRQELVIASHRILRDAITYPGLRNMLLVLKSSLMVSTASLKAQNKCKLNNSFQFSSSISVNAYTT